MREQMLQLVRRAPMVRSGLFAPPTPRFERPRAGANDATVTWVGHSTALLQLGGLNILTDPMWSDHAAPAWGMGPRRVMPPPLALEALPPIDIVLQSQSECHMGRTTRARRDAAALRCA